MFAEGLQAWMRGEATTEADAAGQNVAETLIKWDRFLSTKFKSGPDVQQKSFRSE